ncbi:female salivary gland protein 4 [Frankliniella occidentalis]|nr:female salivary gland protein 4 [Frankliniella occidentalis]
MERVEGLSGGRFVFLHLDFIYLLSHIGDVLTHVKCQVGGCQGSAAFSGDNVYPIREHNHGPDLEMLDLIRFKNELRRLARESSEDYRRLYDNASARFRLGARAYAFPAASQMMQRIRRAHVPPTPTDLLNLQETLRHPNWTNWAKDSEGNDFFRESFVAPDGTQCAVFVSHTFSDLVVRPGWRAHADGTFKSIPLNLNLEQLFSLHVIDEDNHGQKKQAVLHRAVDECHLKPLLQEAPEAARAQKMLMTLPLLPMELIVAGLEYVENHVARNGLTPQFAALLRYMRTYWINEVRDGRC